MGAIIIGIITSFLGSTGDSFRKMSIEQSKLSNSLFAFLGGFMGLFMIALVIILFGFNTSILQDPFYMGLAALIVGVGFANNFLIMYIYKKEKLSALLPYDSLDKIFVVIIGFVLFYGTEQGVGVVTLLITLATIGIIIGSSLDIKKISLPKSILLYFLYKLIKAASILGTGYFLLKYSSIDYVVFDGGVYILLALIMMSILKDSPKNLLKQSKVFYKNRLFASILGRSGYILGLYVIQDSGVIIATLLGFFYITFSIFSMKFIAKDNPSRKQIILAFIVITMVGIGYYFK